MSKLALFLFLIFPVLCFSQIKIRGTVFDKTKISVVEGVKVESTGGRFVYTDSLGRYSIEASENDSLNFTHNGKATMNYAVSSIPDKNNFDIAIQLVIPSAKTYLQEVKVYSKRYSEDSLENRNAYEKIFNFDKPGLSSTISADGVAGADLDELINVFKFRKNKSLLALKKIMIDLEQDKYVNYKFSNKNISRITGLTGNLLDTFISIYKPGYYYIVNMSEIEFNEYVLSCYYQFARLRKLAAMKSEQ